MERAIETFEYANGYTGKIYHDPDTDQPYADDEMVKIVVLHGRYIDPAKGACGRTPEEVRRWTMDNAREWFVVPLWLYDHGGTAYSVGAANPFSCPWDSGRVGIIALKKSEWGKGKGERNAKRLEYARGIADEYTRWANGDCYGYVIEDDDGEQVDSCWGFIGLKYAKEELADSAAHYVKADMDDRAAFANAENNFGAGI